MDESCDWVDKDVEPRNASRLPAPGRGNSVVTYTSCEPNALPDTHNYVASLTVHISRHVRRQCHRVAGKEVHIRGSNHCRPAPSAYLGASYAKVARSLPRVLVFSGIIPSPTPVTRQYPQPTPCPFPSSAFGSPSLVGTENRLPFPRAFQKSITKDSNGSQHDQDEHDRDHWVPFEERG